MAETQEDKPLTSKLSTKDLLPSRVTSSFGGTGVIVPSPAWARGYPLIPDTNTAAAAATYSLHPAGLSCF